MKPKSSKPAGERLSPEEAQELLRRHGGNKAAAARAAGLPRETFRYYLDPDRWNDRARGYYAVNPERYRESNRRYFANMPGLQWQRRLLQMRRIKALQRMAEREEKRGEVQNEG